MSALTILIIYSLAIFAASMLGGWLPSRMRMGHTRTQLMMSFVAGLMLGVACYHLLPHAISTLGGAQAVDRAIWWLMIGLLFMFVLLRAFHFHQHDHSEQEHQHQHQDPATGSHGSHPLSWAGMALGLSLHTLIDGVALGAAIQADAAAEVTGGLFGIGVFVAIVLHKPLDALSITSLMVSGGWGSRARMWVNMVFALICPLGALLFIWGIGQLPADRDVLIGCALAFSAGVFLCISLSDLLPEIQFHSHDRSKLTIALLLGIALAYGIQGLEPGGTHHHSTDHYQPGSPE